MAGIALRLDDAEFWAVVGQISRSIARLGDCEAERRLGCSLDCVLDERFGPLFDIVPIEDGARVSPSVRFDEILAALA